MFWLFHTGMFHSLTLQTDLLYWEWHGLVWWLHVLDLYKASLFFPPLIHIEQNIQRLQILWRKLKKTRADEPAAVLLTSLLTLIINVTHLHHIIVFVLRHHSAHQWVECQSFSSSMKLISAVTLLNIDTVAWLTFSGSIKTQRPTPAVHPAHPHVSSACQLASRLGMKSSYSCWAPAADELSAGVCNCNAIPPRLPPRRAHAVRAWSAAGEEEEGERESGEGWRREKGRSREEEEEEEKAEVESRGEEEEPAEVLGVNLTVHWVHCEPSNRSTWYTYMTFCATVQSAIVFVVCSSAACWPLALWSVSNSFSYQVHTIHPKYNQTLLKKKKIRGQLCSSGGYQKIPKTKWNQWNLVCTHVGAVSDLYKWCLHKSTGARNGEALLQLCVSESLFRRDISKENKCLRAL